MRAARRLSVAAIIAGLALVPACAVGPFPQAAGVIVEKVHDYGTCDPELVKLSSFNSAAPTCDLPSWRFQVRTSRDLLVNMYVDVSTFNTYQVGDHYPS